SHRVGCKRCRNAGSRHHCDLVDVSKEEFRNNALVSEHRREGQASDEMNEGVPGGYARVDSFLQPQSQTIEAPGSSPANQRPENQPIEDRARRSEPCSIVVPCEKPNSI